METFCESVLPEISPSHLETIKAQLKREEEILKEKGFERFPVDPTESKLREPDTFKPLQDVVNSIFKYACPGGSLLSCECDGNCTPWTSRENSSRPDGWIALLVQPQGAKDKSSRPDGSVAQPQGAKDNSSRPDGSAAQPAENTTPKVDWIYIVLAFEFKKDDSEDERHDVSPFPGSW